MRYRKVALVSWFPGEDGGGAEESPETAENRAEDQKRHGRYNRQKKDNKQYFEIITPCPLEWAGRRPRIIAVAAALTAGGTT